MTEHKIVGFVSWHSKHNILLDTIVIFFINIFQRVNLVLNKRIGKTFFHYTLIEHIYKRNDGWADNVVVAWADNLVDENIIHVRELF